jgi:hypothetical protein
MTCGIYQIVNTINGKFYVGQSRNIQKRWRQHTSGLSSVSPLDRGSYPLRAAFLKYKLRTVVSKPGRTGAFEFKIIEECSEDRLLEREQFWINELNPQYNCNIWTPARKKQKLKNQPTFWIQYHNYENLGYLPIETILDESSQVSEEKYEDFLASVSTKKRSVLGAKGDTVFLIVGIGQTPKQYYLWYSFVIEEVQITEEDGDYLYDAFGADGWLLSPPQILNSSFFDEFRKYCGNFGLGFTAINNSPYLETLKLLSETYKPQNPIVNLSRHFENFYTQVSHVNPNEITAHTKRGVARHLAISVYPDEAVEILGSLTTTLVVFNPNNLVINYRNKLLIHTLDFFDSNCSDDEENAELYKKLREGCLKLLEAFELDEETFPAYAIQGWVNVENIFKYDAELFAADQDAHQKGNDLAAFQLECGMVGQDAWGIVLRDPVLLSSPICDVVPPEGILEGSLWTPQEPFHIKAFKLALQAAHEDVSKE